MQAVENGMVVGAQAAWDAQWKDEPLFEARYVCCSCGGCICRGDMYFDTDTGGKECEGCNVDRGHVA